MNPTIHHRPRLARAALFGSFAALTSSVGQTYFIGLFGAYLREAHVLTSSEVGALYGASTLTSGALMFWLGAIADRLPLRQVVAAVVVLLSVGCMLMSAASGAAMLALAFLLLRFGGQGMMSHLAFVAAARTSSGRRGRNVATAALGFIAGEAAWPAIITGALVYVSWRSIWLALAALLLIVVLPALWKLAARIPHESALHHENVQDKNTLRQRDVLKSPRFRAALGIVLVPSFVITAMFFHAIAIGELRNWSAGQIAGGFALYAGAQFSATTLTGRAVDRFGATRLLRFHLFPLSVGVLCGAFLDAAAAIWIVFAGLGFSAGANSVLSGSLWPELFGVRQIGMVRGVYAAFSVVASALSPFLLGEVLSSSGAFGAAAMGCALYCAAVPPLLVSHIRKGLSVS